MTSLASPTAFKREDLLQMFNLKLENILDVSVAHKPEAVYIYIKLTKKLHTCPVCESQTDKVKAYSEKKILHSLLTNYPCFIIYKARRYVCPTCKKTFYEHNPFSHQNMKISIVTVSNVLLDLKKVGETFTSVGKRYGISSTTVATIFDNHVFMSRKILPEFMCMDECYAFSGANGNYVCVLIDFITKNTIDLLPSRKKEDLYRYFDQIPLEERAKVKMLCIDMWETYRLIAKNKLPNALVAVDKFHILQDLHRKVRAVRIRIMNQCKHPKITKELEFEAKHSQKTRETLHEYYQKDLNYYLLKKFDWLLYLNSENRKSTLDLNKEKKMNRRLQRYCNFYDILHLILNIDEELKEAYYFLLRLDTFFRESSLETAKESLDSIINSANSSQIIEVNTFGNTLINWRKEIINSFYIVQESTDKNGNLLTRKINNGIAENKNRTLKLLKNHSNGYKSWERFRNRALYVLNDDATYSLNPIK